VLDYTIRIYSIYSNNTFSDSILFLYHTLESSNK
jgi:hypothetical protein